MNYFLDTEFLEGPQKKLFGYTKPTIDLISIGIKCEDGREYYAISKDFNLKEAWNRFDWKQDFGKPQGLGDTKVYWIRDNVLKPIYYDLMFGDSPKMTDEYFTYSTFKKLINKYGKTNKQIAKEVKHFVANRPIEANKEQWILDYDTKDVSFYGYYSDYDWVVFCWLFGKMIDLPNGFPMYCVDLKQTLNEKCKYSLAKPITNDVNYPKQTNEHNALSDAKWNFELYKFLNKL